MESWRKEIVNSTPINLEHKKPEADQTKIAIMTTEGTETNTDKKETDKVDTNPKSENKLNLGKSESLRKEIANSKPTYMKNPKPEVNQTKFAIMTTECTETNKDKKEKDKVDTSPKQGNKLNLGKTES